MHCSSQESPGLHIFQLQSFDFQATKWRKMTHRNFALQNHSLAPFFGSQSRFFDPAFQASHIRKSEIMVNLPFKGWGRINNLWSFHLIFKVGVKEWEGSLSYLLLLFHYVSMFLLSRHTIEKISLFCNLMTYSNGNWTKLNSLLFWNHQ